MSSADDPQREGGGVAPSGEAPRADDASGGGGGARSRVASRYGGALGRALRKTSGAAGGDGPTIHDAATAAVEHKDGGRPVADAIRAPVEAQLGTDLSAARVHDDPLAQQASAAMGARAFAHGSDIFLGAGERDGDLGLMAHELTHVAQQGAAGARTPQRQVQVGDANSPAEAQADAVAGAVTGGARPAALLVDDGPVGPGQMLKSTFIEQLRAQVTAAASEELGPIESVIGCPYIDASFARYAGQPAAAGEAVLRRYAPGIGAVRTAAEMFPIVTTRVREGVRTWRDSGRAPADLPGADGAGASAPPTGATPTAAPDGEPGQSAAAKIATLGPSQALDPGTARRMGDAFGEDFAGVRIHTGAEAARATADADARAMAIGDHVAFAGGAYQPGTLEGDALIAHELAHTVQQHGASAEAQRLPLPDASAAHEDDADHATAGVLARIYGAGRSLVDGAADRVGPALRGGLGLARCGSPATAPPVPAPAPPIPGTRPATDLHASTGLPSTADQATIQSHLNPTSSGGGGAVATWDAHSTAAIAAGERTRRRTALQSAISTALRAHLRSAVGTVARPGPARRRSTLRQIPMASWEGVGRGAKSVVDARFGGYTAGAALTADLEAARTNQHMDSAGPHQTLFNAWDRGDRAAAGSAINPADLADWMADTDPGVQTAMSTHGFDRYRDAAVDPGEEEKHFLDTILAAFVAANTADLELYDQYDFALTDRETGRIAMFPGIEEGMSDTAPVGGGLSPAERHARWGGFKTMVHEYIHTLEHPAFNAASQGRRIMAEGFCELFTKAVLDPDIAGAAGNAALRTDVEGAAYPADAAAIGTYSAGSYAPYLAHAEAIRDAAPGRDNAVRAAFFQGHVELIGLQTTGAALTAATLADRDTIAVPAGIADVAALAAASGVPEADLRTANPAIGVPLPARVSLPGCREHWVVEASDASGARRTENRAQIASQNGVSEADLVRANPGVPDWNALPAGHKLLVPRH